jgi:hypothetical protein
LPGNFLLSAPASHGNAPLITGEQLLSVPPGMNTFFHLVCLALLASLSSLPDALTAFLWLLTYAQPFAVEYFKHRLEKRQQ